MSIYCSMPAIEGWGCPGGELDTEDALAPGEGGVIYSDDAPGPRAGKVYRSKTEPCTGCDECLVGAPYVYEGSHIVVGPDSPRGGAVQWAVPASHIPTASEPREHYADDCDDGSVRHSYLRLGIVDAHTDTTADVVLDRGQVALLVHEWSRWLEGPFIDDGFPEPLTGEELDHA